MRILNAKQLALVRAVSGVWEAGLVLVRFVKVTNAALLDRLFLSLSG